MSGINLNTVFYRTEEAPHVVQIKRILATEDTPIRSLSAKVIAESLGSELKTVTVEDNQAVPQLDKLRQEGTE
jgi:hypothetical protein